jgi:hypothetical protein
MIMKWPPAVVVIFQQRMAVASTLIRRMNPGHGVICFKLIRLREYIVFDNEGLQKVKRPMQYYANMKLLRKWELSSVLYWNLGATISRWKLNKRPSSRMCVYLSGLHNHSLRRVHTFMYKMYMLLYIFAMADLVFDPPFVS